jgi:hypothetical protein
VLNYGSTSISKYKTQEREDKHEVGGSALMGKIRCTDNIT